MATPHTPADNRAEILVWALTAAIARDDLEGARLLDEAADEATVRDALAYAIGGSIGALLRATIAEHPGADLHRDMDRALAAIAEAASRQALAEASR